MKQCSKCNQWKPESEFHKSLDSFTSACKTCRNRAHREYKKKTEAGIKSRKKYSKSEKNKVAQKRWFRSEKGKIYREKNREKKRLSDKKYRRTKKGKESQYRGTKKHREKYPQRVKARSAVSHEVRMRRFPKATDLLCVKCSNRATQYHHHNEYSKKYLLDVIPLCLSCHREEEHIIL